MLCKRCKKEIDELEIYCDECKEAIRKEKELEKEIEENKKLNELENTKELINFDNLVKETIEDSDIKEKLGDIVNFDDDEFLSENKNPKFIIIFSLIFFPVVIIIGVLLFLNVGKEPIKQPQTEIDYAFYIKEYGNDIKRIVKEYLNEKNEIPSWAIIVNKLPERTFDINCNIHDIYMDGSIYLNECKIDNEQKIYTYGEKKQEVKGKIIDIYKSINSNDYYDNEKEDTKLIGSITCKTDTCNFITAFQDYVLIAENTSYYLYNYNNNSILFGPFLINENYENNMLSYDDILYGILYEENNIQKIYNVKRGKILDNLKVNGDLLIKSVNYDPSIMYSYGYIILNNENKNLFVNLNTGNISYTIDGEINSFIKANNKNLVYITTINDYNKKITIYNSNGKRLFNGNEFNYIRLNESNIIVSNDTNYYIYDSNLNLILTSKSYDNVLGIYDDFVLAVSNNNLQLLDYKDNILATYDLIWDKNYKVDNLSTGIFTESNNRIIYIIIDINDGQLKYFYNLDTKQFGKK